MLANDNLFVAGHRFVIDRFEPLSLSDTCLCCVLFGVGQGQRESV
jgi:hypothetical protein